MPMTRGKQQVLYQFLPGKLFDHSDGAIARVESVYGRERDDVCPELLLDAIKHDAIAWDVAMRPNLPDRYLDDASQFAFIEPHEVVAKMYPLVFRCPNVGCEYVF